MNKIRESLSLKISLLIAVPLLVLTFAAALLVTRHQSEMLAELTFEKARLSAKIGARTYGLLLDDAIDDGILTVQEVFDRDYQVIEGYDWGKNPKYHTKYDFYTDHAVILMQDEFLEHPDFVFALGQDVNGYIPTHNTRFQKPITGDPTVDLAGNRTKRIFDDPVGLAAGKNLEPTLLQEYRRDTGEVMWDVSSPIFVKGKHWGGFRLAVSMERMAARRWEMFGILATVFTALAVGAVLAIFLMTRQAMRPVEGLTAAADQISLGEALDEPIAASSRPDEIGRLARAVDRLRVSMRAAMQRLGE